jgi:hypothetical protein
MTSHEKQQRLAELAERAERRREELRRARAAARQQALDRNRDVRRAALAQGQ